MFFVFVHASYIYILGGKHKKTFLKYFKNVVFYNFEHAYLTNISRQAHRSALRGVRPPIYEAEYGKRWETKAPFCSIFLQFEPLWRQMFVSLCF